MEGLATGNEKGLPPERTANLPFDSTSDIAAVAQSMLEPFPLNEYPNLAAFITEHAMKPGYDFADEFEYGLDLILDGLKRALATA